MYNVTAMFNHKQTEYCINTIKYSIHTKLEVKPRCLTISKPEKNQFVDMVKMVIVNCLIAETRSDLYG